MIAAAEAYGTTENILHSLTRKFVERYGGDHSEILSECHVAFMGACSSYDPDRGAKFSTWCQLKVAKGLLTHLRNMARRHARFPTEEVWLEEVPERENTPIMKRLQELSDDARTVAALVIDSPYELRCLIAGEGRKTPKRVRHWLGSFLGGIGWTTARIAESFAEIAEAVSL